VNYFGRACGTARRVWNWALAEWNRQYAAGGRPNAHALKRQFNAIKYLDADWLDEDGQPWLKTMHRDSHAQPFAHLGKAWARFFKDVKAGKPAHAPQFKKKGRCPDSFYIANDKFRLDGRCAVLPKVGAVALCEALRFDGHIMGASVRREADRWFLSVQVEVPQAQALRRRTGHGVVGVDLGLKAAATLSTGESVQAPKPLKRALRRLKLRGRRLSRKLTAAKKLAGIAGPIPKGTRLPVSANRKKASRALARLHARIARIRADFLHKLTTKLCRENQTVVIEDLNVKGMMVNERLARAIADVGFGEFRRQVTYKTVRYGGTLVIAPRFYPSSKLCSTPGCGWKKEDLALKDREWRCPCCGRTHERDHNAARNLERLATVATSAVGTSAATALPVASLAATSGTGAGLRRHQAGK
jgi:putative transposase